MVEYFRDCKLYDGLIVHGQVVLDYKLPKKENIKRLKQGISELEERIVNEMDREVKK